MQIYYNPIDKQCKSDIGATRKGDSCTFKVFTDSENCSILLAKDGAKPSSFNMKKVNDGFEITLTAQEVGLFYYAFDLGDGNYIGLGENYLGVITDNPIYFQTLVYRTEYQTPEFIKGGLIYQIFPDRFAISGDVKKVKGRVYHDNLADLPFFMPNSKGKVVNNDFYGGNLRGIIDKLPYLKDLSVSVIYLNPIFKAFSNHRYDTGDYLKIDDNLGTEEDLIELIKKADELGIKIILDGVFSHTGDDSVYFNKYGNYNSLGAYQSKDSPYYEWYNFQEFPNKYSSWWGIDVLPEINEKNNAYNNFINGVDGVIEHYTKLGLGGWRLDVADELPTQFLINLRKAVKGQNPDAIIIGEVWEDATNKVSYSERRSYFQGNQLDSIMNYVLKDSIIDFVKNGNSKRLSYAVKEQIDHYPKSSLHSLMNILGTHDTFRIISALGGKDMSGKSKVDMANTTLSFDEYKKGVELVKMATLLQYTLCGVPSVYYGDEIGMQGFSDPFNRCFFGATGVSKELQSFYKKLGKIRKISVFKEGDFTEIYSDKGAFVFERRDERNIVTVGINNGSTGIFINFEGVLYDLLTNERYENSIELNPGQICLLHDELI